MSKRHGVLQNPVILAAVLLTSLYGSLLSWLSVKGHSVHRPMGHAQSLILGLACAVFITASIALRSKSRGDRTVFGALAGALVLATLEQTLALSPAAQFAANVAKASLWSTAALGSVVVLRVEFNLWVD
jgi:hypothetical protein